jgi:hypothetical protein
MSGVARFTDCNEELLIDELDSFFVDKLLKASIFSVFDSIWLSPSPIDFRGDRFVRIIVNVLCIKTGYTYDDLTS